MNKVLGTLLLAPAIAGVALIADIDPALGGEEAIRLFAYDAFSEDMMTAPGDNVVYGGGYSDVMTDLPGTPFATEPLIYDDTFFLTTYYDFTPADPGVSPRPYEPVGDAAALEGDSGPDDGVTASVADSAALMSRVAGLLPAGKTDK